MGGRPLATTAPSRSRSTVDEADRRREGTAMGGRDRTERMIIAAMVALLVVQTYLVVRMIVG
jgi:hypothetical protein